MINKNIIIVIVSITFKNSKNNNTLKMTFLKNIFRATQNMLNIILKI